MYNDDKSRGFYVSLSDAGVVILFEDSHALTELLHLLKHMPSIIGLPTGETTGCNSCVCHHNTAETCDVMTGLSINASVFQRNATDPHGEWWFNDENDILFDYIV